MKSISVPFENTHTYRSSESEVENWGHCKACYLWHLHPNNTHSDDGVRIKHPSFTGLYKTDRKKLAVKSFQIKVWPLGDNKVDPKRYTTAFQQLGTMLC